jgi:hypothetical protein
MWSLSLISMDSDDEALCVGMLSLCLGDLYFAVLSVEKKDDIDL